MPVVLQLPDSAFHLTAPTGSWGGTLRRAPLLCLIVLFLASCGSEGGGDPGATADGAAGPGSRSVVTGTGPSADSGSAVPRPAGWVLERPVYTMAQAERGEGIYLERCGVCHIPAFFTGLGFRSAWAGNTVGELYRFIAATMPQDTPGTMLPDEYADVLAYIFQVMGMPAGTEPLPADFRELNTHRIALPR